MDAPNTEYLDWQLSLFDGGHSHVMVELTAHLHGTGNTIPIGIRIVDHPTGEMIAYEVPIIRGDLMDLETVAAAVVEVLAFVRGKLSPF